MRDRIKPRLILLCIQVCVLSSLSVAQTSGRLSGRELYNALKAFEIKGAASVSNLVLKRDRAEMTFNGSFYFASSVNGHVTGAVFVGDGSFSAAAPQLPFEKENMIRLINTDVAKSDFHIAVLRFSDDTYEIIGKASDSTTLPTAEVQKLATDFEPRLMKETGTNISARLLVALANNESPGIFVAQFDKGTRNRFTYMIDYQARIPGSSFGINGGEKVLLFSYAPYAYENDVWIATYSEEDFKKGRASYSDEYDLVNPVNYAMEVDLRDARHLLKTRMRIDFESLVPNLNVLPMIVNDGLTEYDNRRLKHSMHIQTAKSAGQDISFVQENWESGLTLILPRAMQKNEKFSVEITMEGDFIDEQRTIEKGYYPQSNTSWYPRHGFLKRSTFNLLFRSHKNDTVCSAGKLVREAVWPDTKDDRLTEFSMDKPVSFVTFAAGSLERKTEKRKFSFGEMTLEFYSLPSSVGQVKESFMLGEMGNALDYLSHYFGPYPYGDFKAAFHPFNYGQGFPTMLMLPKADSSNRAVYSFIAHETSHQWWGNIVAWRSYRDQWLSEGFAEYSGILYTQLRAGKNSARDLIKEIRYALTFPPKQDSGVGQGKVGELGSLILGLRLQSRKSTNAYEILTYGKGAMVLRMLHFLFTDPSSGKDQPFFDMMADFVKRYENKAATTEEFIAVASEHFARTPVAQHFNLKDLNWFFTQWVYEAKLPSYRLEYKMESNTVTGTLIQENAPKDWFMPLPVTLKFDNNQEARSLVYANGPQTPFSFSLPMKLSSIELDPDLWVLSEKTSTKKQ
ncbi:MAG TPA: M1 family aminopeptidase [Acidobacteriota bacterium]|nr:M1 family aminopeptidase [Acidobacteriota bacterium]